MSLDGTSVQMTGSGFVELSRRDVPRGDGTWVHTQLVDRETQVCLLAEFDAVDQPVPGGGINCQLTARDVENRDNGEAYGATLNISLSWGEVVKLRDFLSYLLSLPSGESTG